MSDQMRDFDGWWKDEMSGCGVFNDFDKAVAQKAWVESRASLCVTLPDRIDRGCDCESCDCGNSSDRESVARADAHNALLLELSEAITKTGVRVK